MCCHLDYVYLYIVISKYTQEIFFLQKTVKTLKKLYNLITWLRGKYSGFINSCLGAIVCNEMGGDLARNEPSSL